MLDHERTSRRSPSRSQPNHWLASSVDPATSHLVESVREVDGYTSMGALFRFRRRGQQISKSYMCRRTCRGLARIFGSDDVEYRTAEGDCSKKVKENHRRIRYAQPCASLQHLYPRPCQCFPISRQQSDAITHHEDHHRQFALLHSQRVLT